MLQILKRSSLICWAWGTRFPLDNLDFAINEPQMEETALGES